MGDQVEVKRVVCNFCQGRCRLLLHSENGRLLKLEEDKSFPLAGGVSPPVEACIRFRNAKEWMYHPDRLSFPLKRAGDKGEGKWERVSWDQALDEVAEKLKEIKQSYGAEAIGLTNGTGRTMDQIPIRFCHLLGTPNYFGQTSICFGPCIGVAQAMYGWSVRHRNVSRAIGKGTPEAVTKCTLMLGMNPAQAVPRLWKSLLDSQKLGGKLIVVDPRRTETAALADLWLQLRPGTDTALLMGMINVIINEELYDKDFVEKWCYGFDKLVERAQEYPPAKVAEITWVPEERIKEAARMYATTKPAISTHGMGTEHMQNCIEAIQARYILTAITGNIDVEGGDYIPGPPKTVPMAEQECDGMLSPEQKRKQIGADRFKLLAWPGRDLIQGNVKRVWGVECGAARGSCFAHAPSAYRAILTGKPYPLKAVITVASNPMVTPANTRLVYKALKSLELYVVADYWLTPSAELADYVFPIASWMERPWLWNQAGHDCGTWAGEQGLPSVIPGEYDRRNDYEFFRGLGIRLGQEEQWPWESLEQFFDYTLKPMGLSFKEFMDKGGYDFPPDRFKKYERTGFGTPTGKVELYSTIFERLGYDPLPRYEESFENPISTPEIAKEYPLMLITGGRFHPMFHSEHRQVDSTRRRHPHPLVQINPETAAGLDILDGDWVWIETRRGRIRMKARLTEGIDPRVVHAEHGWWFPELPGEEPWLHGVWESNVNVLTNDDPEVCNKLSGGWPLKTALCKVYKVKTY